MASRTRHWEWGKDIGTPIAVLRLEPGDLASRGVTFESGYDDLDNIKIAWLRDNVALVRHEGSPVPGTEIVITEFRSEYASRALNDLTSVLQSLRLSKEDLSWIRDDLDARPTPPIGRGWWHVIERAVALISGHSRAGSSSRIKT